jgi:peptidoglycan/xylan/chitin deacetylase (PgdA/CDA1 family)
MNWMTLCRGIVFAAALLASSLAVSGPAPFAWPDGHKAAVSLSWDDARDSQLPIGIPVLDKYGIKATFFIIPENAAKNVDGWKKVLAHGHEIGNHTLNHPCTGNLDFAAQKALEDYSLEKIQFEMTGANEQIHKMLGVTPVSFAYPCGNSWIGRGLDTRSFVPLVSSMFVAGRLWHGEAANNPRTADTAQALAYELDGKTFEEVLPLLEDAQREGKWIIFGGHEMNKDGNQTTRIATLEKLLPYLKDPKNGFWVAPVGTVGKYIRDAQKAAK